MWFKFTDVSRMYTESTPFELRFVAVPAPAGVASFMMLGLCAMRRRR